jgi:hypothetical protein
MLSQPPSDSSARLPFAPEAAARLSAACSALAAEVATQCQRDGHGPECQVGRSAAALALTAALLAAEESGAHPVERELS